MSASASRKLDRAAAMGWTRSLPKWCGPSRWIKTPRTERRAILSNLRRMQVNNAWVPVIAKYEEAAS